MTSSTVRARVVPASSAVAPTTPEAMRNRRRVTVSMASSSVDRVLGGDQGQRDQPLRLGRRGGEDLAGAVGPLVDRQQPTQRIDLGVLVAGRQRRERRLGQDLGQVGGRLHAYLQGR